MHGRRPCRSTWRITTTSGGGRSSTTSRVYEKICLEGFQSGLSWLTILRKRESFRRAFAGFVPDEVARFGPRDVERLLGDAGIVRHRGKIEATIANAKAMVEVRAELRLTGRIWCGRSNLHGLAAGDGRRRGTSVTCLPQHRSRRHCRRNCSDSGSASSDRPRCTRRCRRSASRTTTSSAATPAPRAPLNGGRSHHRSSLAREKRGGGRGVFDRGDHAPGTGYAYVADPDGCVLEIDQLVRKGATPTLDPSEQSRAGDENRTRVLSLGKRPRP